MATGSIGAESMNPDAFERHYTTQEIAEQWNCSAFEVHRIFAREPGVLRLGAMTSRRRTRHELRIPESVAARVYAERMNRR